MKILQVVSRMNNGGIAGYLETLCLGLESESMQVVLALGKVQDEETEYKFSPFIQNIRVSQMFRKINPIRDVIAWIQMYKIVRRLRPQIIHSHAFKAGLISRLLPIKSIHVHTFHGHHFGESRFSSFAKKIIFLIEKRLASRTDYFTVVGDKVQQELIDLGVIRLDNSEVIYPAVRPPKLIERETARTRLGIPEEKKQIAIWMGRYVHVKNPEFVAELAKSNKDWFFVMAGEGPLQKFLEELKLPNLKVLPWTDRILMLSIADVLLLTSFSEGSPMTAIEGITANIPIISSSAGSLIDIVDEGVTGYCCKLEIDDFNMRLESIAKGGLQRDRSKIESIKKRFEEESFVAQHVTLYNKLLSVKS
jgi:glycosyltransferase involved in cell wall biosynthesis